MSQLLGVPHDPLLSVVIPVFNEAATIEEIIPRVLAVPLRIQLIVVDDCSTDGTREALNRLQEMYGFTLLLQSRNQGKGAALRRGFAEVRGDLVAVQDADLEYSPEEFPMLIELIREGRADVVYGSRFLGRHRVFLFTHYLGNRFLTLVANVLYNTMLSDMETCYKVMRAEVLRSMTLRSNRFGIEPELTAKIFKRGYRVYEMPITYDGPRIRRRKEDRVARRCGRALGAAAIPVQRVNVFFRLLEYARPHRARMVAALGAMVLYGAASAGVVALIQPIFDEVLPSRENLAPIAAAILVVYFLKGIGAYLSSYLMTDVGQRVVRDLRNVLFRHILGQSVAFFSLQTTGRLMSRITNDVGQVQRAVSETIGDLTRESLSLFAFTALLFYYDARLALVCLTGAPLVVYPLVRLGQRVRRTARRSQEAVEQISHVSAEAITGHRIVKAFGAEGREAGKFERRLTALLPDQHEGHERALCSPAAHGVHWRDRLCRGACLRQPGDRGRAAVCG